MVITTIADNLYLKDGIYFSKNQSNISYPEEGNQICFQLEDNSFWFNHRNNCIIEMVKRHNNKQMFFDIGGGNGFVAKGLQETGIKTVLIEPGIQGCLNAKTRNLDTIVCSTLEDAGFSIESIPSIGLFDVVEHIENDISFLKYIHSYLIPNGLVYITVPAYQWLWSEDDVIAGHYRRYTVKNLEKKLLDNGFEIVQSTYIFSILPIAVYLFRTLPSKFGLIKKNSADRYNSEHKKGNGFVSKMIDKIWAWERNKIINNKSIKVGGSCLVVAKKITNN
ncbi:class I SAM-dependent methyltransferase [Flavobacterium urocaniciphilum]|uniref:Methyltransferase domain-containing protein n=1 Tax=Flavobacterium urocaniciphilum TaxID=1299341 RepID=A0A1H9BRM6_9FLAO|nr:class I SAM-dependent methyltransferase [Flavobacterium urocaniciphilum]SEP91610.1 Methyltransferase domain-containing protein [Flavobacterium urocaniciphilum]